MSPRFLTGAALVGALAVLQPYRPFVVSGSSMSPAFMSGQIVIGNVRQTRVARGDVVVFRHGDETMIKRVAYLPSDRIELFRIIDQWLPASNKLVYRTLRTHKFPKRDYAIPEGCLYVIGDNAPASVDSRTYGPIDMSDVIAVVPGKESDRPSWFAGVHETANAIASL